jgi:hypothetical protein
MNGVKRRMTEIGPEAGIDNGERGGRYPTFGVNDTLRFWRLFASVRRDRLTTDGPLVIGVRWLGPDHLFIEKLKRQQADRDQSRMDVWGSGIRREIAEQLARWFKKEVQMATLLGSMLRVTQTASPFLASLSLSNRLTMSTALC